MNQHDLLNEFLVLNAMEFLQRGVRDGRSSKWTRCERRIVKAALACVKDHNSELEDSYRYSFADSQFFFTEQLANFFNEPEWALMADAAGIDLISDDFEYNFLLRPNRKAPRSTQKNHAPNLQRHRARAVRSRRDRIIHMNETLTEMPPPPNTAPIEGAIGRIKKTLRTRTGPRWNDQDFNEFETACRVLTNKEEAIPHGLERRFLITVDKLLWRVATEHNADEWNLLGRRIDGNLDTSHGVLAIGTASRTIQRIIASPEASAWGKNEVTIIVNGVNAILFGELVPPSFKAEFSVNLLALASFLRNHSRSAQVTNFGIALCERLLSKEEISQFPDYALRLEYLEELFVFDHYLMFMYRPKLTLDLLQRLCEGVLVTSNVGGRFRERVPKPSKVPEMWRYAKALGVDGRLCNLQWPWQEAERDAFDARCRVIGDVVLIRRT